MKKKRTINLSCERARAFPIEKALAKLGHFPTTSTEKEAWFLSPLRTEAQASFKVSKKINRWYDHGAGKGGNVIDLICLITKGTVKEALQLIQRNQISFPFQQQSHSEQLHASAIKIISTKDIYHPALVRYLFDRCIPIGLASRYLKELRYYLYGKEYFALGLENDKGGWEIRNARFKAASSPKWYTHVKKGNRKLLVTEGMFDMLSLLILDHSLEDNYDLLILNSITYHNQILEHLLEYEHIILYLDNDAAGQKACKNLQAKHPHVEDGSFRYGEFKDANDYLKSFL